MKLFFDSYLKLVEKETGEKFFPVQYFAKSGKELKLNYCMNEKGNVYTFNRNYPQIMKPTKGKFTLVDDTGKKYNITANKLAEHSLPPKEYESFVRNEFRKYKNHE
ncbi:TPA_asm: hypothetical protein GZJ24_15230 [Listeria monocytogenes]|nr:hypothetical protein [Listeria monocytogenes]